MATTEENLQEQEKKRIHTLANSMGPKILQFLA